jgi:hypothetical protein
VSDWPPRSDAFAPRASERYVLRGGGPPAASDELEQRALQEVEVIVLWQGDVLAVSHLRPPGSFFIGGPGSACDVALPADILGAERLCVAVGSRSEISALLPAQARVWLTLPDGSSRRVEQAAQPAAPGRAPLESVLPLGLGQRAHLRLGPIEVQVAAVAAGRPPARRRSLGLDATTLGYFGLSALSVAGLLALLSLTAPPLGLTQGERATLDQIYLLQSYLTASAERLERQRSETSERPRQSPASPPPLRRAPPASALAEPEPEPALPALPEAALADAGEPTPRTPLARARELEAARSFGMISLLGSHLAELDDPRLHFRRELSSAEVAQMDRMFNPEPQWDEGPGGLSLSGTGLHAGGKADVIARGVVGTVSEGEGTLPPHFAHAARSMGSHRPAAPAPVRGVDEPLSPALVRRAVNARSSELRECDETGRLSNPALAGSATLSFVVEPDGHVERVDLLDSDLPPSVGACLQNVFRRLRFTPSGSGPLSVKYRVRFAP